MITGWVSRGILLNCSRLAAVLVVALLASCGGSRSPSGADAPPTDDLSVSQVGPATVAAGSNATFTIIGHVPAILVSTGRPYTDGWRDTGVAAGMV